MNNKKIIWKHPFNHFHIGGIEIKEEEFEKNIGKEVIDASFIEESIHATLLGAEFDVYSESRMSDFVITNIEWDDEKRTSGEVYI